MIAAIKKVDKKASDTTALKGLMALYNDAATQHLNNIDLYNTISDESKWPNILREYSALESLNNIVRKSKVASGYINPISF